MKRIFFLLALFTQLLAPSSRATYQPFPALVGNSADGEAAVSTGLIPTESYPMLFNGTTWDRMRGSNGSFNITAPSALDITFPSILVPPTSNLLNAAGTVQAKITPGGTYTLCVSIDNATLGATANTLASCTTTAFTGSNLSAAKVVTYTGAAPSVGQLLAGTGISPGSYVVSVSAGVSFTMNLPATASGTVTLNVTAGSFAGTFESSPDGTTWTAISVIPKTYSCDQSATTSFVAPGLWQYNAGALDNYLRINLTSVSAGGAIGNLGAPPRLRLNIDAFDRNASRVNLPYISYIAATAATFPTGIPVIMPVDCDGLSEIAFDLNTLTGTSQTITWRQSNDENGVLFQGLTATTTQAAQNSAAITATGAGAYRIAPALRFFYASFTAGTAVTANTIGGVIAKVGVQPAIQAVHITTNNVPMNISQFGGQTPNIAQSGGSTNRSVPNYNAGAVAFTAYSAQAWAAASGSGAVIADTNGGGAVYSFDISTTAWTVGTSTGMVVVVEDSTDSGTTYVTRWMTEPITAISHVNIPALQIMGRCRMRWFHISGSATTATVTVVAQALSYSPNKQNQYFDRTASVGSGTAASGTNSAAYDISSLKAITVILDSGTATAVASFKVQMSQDGLKWYDASAATAVSSTSAAMTPIPLTAGVYGRFLRVTCTATGTTQLMNAIHIYGTN